MIVDRIEHLSRYTNMMKSGESVEQFLNFARVGKLGVGACDIPETDCKAIFQVYETQQVEACRWESHRKYVDIQCIREGSEVVRWTSTNNLVPDGGYQPEKDAEYYRYDPIGDAVTLHAGWFALFFPGEGHMAKVAAGEPETVTKIVIKVPVKGFLAYAAPSDPN